tara:strand:- start:37793 stop:38080 length:288 start_codon:yes stop_codon:yes gene_type:complete
VNSDFPLFTPHLSMVQTVLGSVGDAVQANVDRLFVDLPLKEQVAMTPVDFIKIKLYIEKNVGFEIDPESIDSSMSINKMADKLLLQRQVSLAHSA